VNASYEEGLVKSCAIPAKQNYEFTFPDIPFPLEIPLNNYPEESILCALFLCHIISKLPLVKI
jgi:hypothetical protein